MRTSPLSRPATGGSRAGREAPTPAATFWINVLGVWVVDFVALCLARRVDLTLGLIAICLTIVNAIMHIGIARARREYNPGLVTAVVLFLPLGAWSLYEVDSAADAGLGANLLAAGVAVALHMVICLNVRRRLGSPTPHSPGFPAS